MDVIFEPQKGKEFIVEVGFFDTVLEFKEKIQKYHNIPVSKQTLIFNNRILQDDHDVGSCEILHNSRIQLVIAPEPTDQKPENYSSSSSPAGSNKTIRLNVKVPSSSVHVILPVDMDVNDSIGKLKEKIHEIEGVPINRLMLYFSNSQIELRDHQILNECEISDNSEIEVKFRQSPTPSAVPSGTNNIATPVVQTGGASKKLKVMLMLLPNCTTRKVALEVNASDNVVVLKKEIEKLQQTLHFRLPEEGYFFIYNQNVMEEDRSFRWHHVAQGDTIEIFNGCVTGGS